MSRATEGTSACDVSGVVRPSVQEPEHATVEDEAVRDISVVLGYVRVRLMI